MKPIFFIVLFIAIVVGSIFAIEYYSRQTPSYTAQTEPIGPTGGLPTLMPTQTPTPMPGKKYYANPPEMTLDTAKTYTATLTTNKGVMKITLFAKENPITVNNFVSEVYFF